MLVVFGGEMGREVRVALGAVAGIAALGGRCGFIGQVADDQLGRVFAHDIRAGGIAYRLAQLTGHGEPLTVFFSSKTLKRRENIDLEPPISGPVRCEEVLPCLPMPL